jgi:protein involved in polysaccharide export with SLBB domain
VTQSRASKTARALPPARPTAATAAYNVGIGDVLDIRLENLPTRESTLFTVLQNGTLEYPLLTDPISVVGLTTDEIAYRLSKEIKVIESANVSVNVRDYASHTLVVTGAVDSPGRKVLRREAMPLYTVLAEALVRAEATSATIVRNGKEAAALPLDNEQAMATLVQAGDVIRIGSATATGKQFVYIGGEVASAGEKSFREGMTLTQALLSAGGVSRAGKTIVKIARRGANGFLSTNEYSLRAIQEGKSPDPIVQAGDRIEVVSAM